MLKNRLRKVLTVIMAGAVIGTSSAMYMPVFAAENSVSAIAQSYHISNYDSEREFQPKRCGDIVQYSKNQLQFSFGNTNRIPTGIWGSVGDKLKVYIEADDNDPLPSLHFVQHIGRWQDLSRQKTVPLKKGVNEITVPQTYDSMDNFDVKVEPGSCIYLINPYTEEQQSANVRVYIEGGDKFPIYYKGDDIKEFVTELRDYYSHYSKGEQGYHNASEICGEYVFATLTLERVYDAIAKEGISPQKTAENMDDLFCYMMEFDDIEPSEYNNLYQHIKTNQPYAGAYAYFDIIGIQDNGWAGSLFSGDFGWGFPHELGHIIDNNQKVLTEVTNNVWSIKYVLDNELYFDIAIDKPIADPNKLSASESTTLWSVDPRGYTAVYMLWDLEVYCKGINGKIDDMLRHGSCGDSKIDSYLSGCSVKEKVAAYASKISGLDLTYYFKKYGYLTSLSSGYTNAINAMGLSKSQPKIWYYDTDAYIKSRGSNINVYSKPSLSNYDSTAKTMYFNVPMAAAKNHLGFEIMKDGNFVAYVWDSQYTDANLSGTYTVNAYDRSLYKYASFTVNTSDSSMTDKYVAKVGSSGYRTVEEAINAAPNNSTVYLLASATIKNTITIDGKNITLMPASETVQTVIYNGVGSGKYVFDLKNDASLKVMTASGADNTLVFDSQKKQSKSYFHLSSGNVLELGKGVTVRRCKSSADGSVAAAYDGSDITLNGCLIEINNTSGKGTFCLSDSTLHSSGNTVIRYNRAEKSGAAIQAEDSSVKLSDTRIYRNYNNAKSSTGTIYLSDSDIRLCSGTVIEGNHCDWYDAYTGIEAADINSSVTADGNVNITDNVCISSPVAVTSKFGGHMTLRPNPEYSKLNNTMLIPVSDLYLNSDILKKLSIVSNDFSLDFKNNTVYLSDTAPLVNDCTFSGTNFCTGDTLKIYLNAHGGDGKYSYSCDISRLASDEVEVGDTLKADSSKAFLEYTFDKAGSYLFTLTAKDSSGKTAKISDKAITVYNKLVNKSTVSAGTVVTGNPVTITGSAQGGSGSYKYAVYYMNSADKKWVKVQDYKSSVTEKVTLKTKGTYTLRVKAKDSVGNITNKDFKITVNDKLTNTSKISATTIDLGKTVTVTASAAGGAGGYTYAMLYKKTSDTKWTTKQGFKANAKIDIKPANATAYDICAKVRDAQGTVEKKFFKVTVNKNIENQSTISAQTIKLGDSVTVKCIASGGSGFYNYAVYYKKTSDTKWTTKQNYQSSSIVRITPTKATAYDICVKVRDNADRESKKYFKLTVTNADLTNHSKISAENIKSGTSLTMTAVAAGGTSPYRYAFYYKDVNAASWTTKQDFSTNSVSALKLPKEGTYNICIKVKDSKGTVSKKYFTVTVQK